jgi:hypothetical protein
MTTIATVLSEISKKYQVQVDFLVAHTRAEALAACTVHTPTMTTETRLMQLASNYEVGLKTGWPEWIVHDEARDVAIVSQSEPTPDALDPDWLYYDIVASCTVNATARITINVETDLDPESTEGEAFIQAQAEAAAAAWITERAFTAI